MLEMYKLEDLILHILKTKPETRYSDMFLYYEYVKYNLPNEDMDKVFLKVFREKDYRKEKGLKEFESVSRCRRKIQAYDETLKPNKVVQLLRTEKERDYIEYAIN